MNTQIRNKNLFLTSTLLSRQSARTALILAGLMAAATPAFADDLGVDIPVVDTAPVIETQIDIDSTTTQPYELPQGGNVASGDATLTYTDDQLTVDQSSQNAVYDFDTYRIGEEATTEYKQPNSSSIAVNRVSRGKAVVNGKLKANGQIVILNENGVFFGSKSRVDVGGLVASTGKLDYDEFTKNNKIRLTDIGSTGTVRNDGQINIRDAGVAAFVAPNVINNGVIEAKMGKIALASGSNAATVDLYGDGLVSLALDESTSHALIENTGVIRANGGKIAITAAAAADAVDNLVNLGGVVEASSVSSNGGVIRLGGTGKVKVSGTVNASGATGGGTVEVTGKSIETTKDALVMADANTNGNGGTIKLFANEDAIYAGALYARGGANGGNGGFIETSARGGIALTALANTTAANGVGGTFLIDPDTVTIHDGTFQGFIGPISYLTDAYVAEVLGVNGNVTILADNDINIGTDDVGVDIGNGNIDFSNYSLGQTTGDATLDAPTLNFNKDFYMGSGGINVAADTVNLGARLYNTFALIVSNFDQSDVKSTTASTVNVLSPNAYIQEGIYLADDGAVVNVASGTYLEAVNVAKSVDLRGANTGAPGFGPRTAETIVDPNSPGFYVTADNVTIDGFYITGADDGILVDGADGTKLLNNIIFNNTLNGIRLEDADNTQINNNLIDTTVRNGIDIHLSNSTNIHDNAIRKAGLDGIYSSSNTGLTIDTNSISDSRVDGIDIEGTFGTILITNNTVANSGLSLPSGVDDGTGIEVSSAKNAVISGNQVYSSQWDGIFVDRGLNIQVTNNLVEGTTFNHGINVANLSVGTLVEDNTVMNTRRHGINLHRATDTTVRLNDILLTKLDGIHSSDSKNVWIDENNLTDIREDGIDVEGTSGIIEITDNTITNVGVGIPSGVDEMNGIELSSGKNALISGNKVYNAQWDGILVDKSTGTQVIGNLVDGTVYNHGIDVANLSFSTLVQDNTVMNTRRHGINLHRATDTTVRLNDILLTKLDGIHSSDSKNVWIDENNLTDIREDGIDVEGTSGIIEITDNTILNIGVGILPAADQMNGIELSSGKNALISGNKVYNAQWDGILVDKSTGTQVIGNLVDGTVYNHGIDVANLSFSTLVQDNTVMNTRRHGINLHRATDTTVRLNDILLTKLDGIHSSDSKNVWIDENNLTDIREDGIDVEGTSGIIEITDNTINNIGVGVPAGTDQMNGIELSSGKNALIDGNTINNTQYAGIWVDQGSSGTTISNNIVTGATVYGLGLGGYQNDATGLTVTTLSDNDFTSLLDGALFQSGNIDFQGINTFTFTGDGLVFAPDLSKPAPFLQVVGDTFGTTVLNDGDTLGYFINLHNGAMFGPGNPTILDARFVTFNDGVDFINYVPGSFTLPFPTWNALENRLHDYDDTGVDGQIFFQPETISTFSILGADINDILDDEQPVDFQQEGGSVTILGLPFARLAQINEPQNPADIEPAAGGNDEEVANIEPAAGGTGDQAGCWAQVYNHFSTENSPITFSINDTPMGLLGSQANCQQATGGTGL